MASTAVTKSLSACREGSNSRKTIAATIFSCQRRKLRTSSLNYLLTLVVWGPWRAPGGMFRGIAWDTVSMLIAKTKEARPLHPVHRVAIGLDQ